MYDIDSGINRKKEKNQTGVAKTSSIPGSNVSNNNFHL